MAREMENIEYGRVCGELEKKLLGARIENIYQVDEKTFRLKIGNSQIMCTLGERLHETKYVPKETGGITNFIEFVRSRVRGGRVAGIRQQNDDRIVRVEVKAGETPYSIVLEMFGQGNFILIGEGGIILRALSCRKWKGRDIFPRKKYILPPKQKLPPNPTVEQMKEVDGKKYAIAVFSRIPLGALYAREALKRSEVGEKKNYLELGEGEIKKVLEKIGEIRREIAPALYFENGSPVQFSCATLSLLKELEKRETESLSEAADEYYFVNMKSAREIEKAERAKRAQERIKRQEEHIRKLEAEVERNKECAKKIYENFGRVEEEIRKARRSGKRLASLEL